MVTWLREVLITANTQELLDVAARVLAERAIIDLHEPWDLTGHGNDPAYGYACMICSDADAPGDWPCDTLRWLAYGHRFDAPGWRQEWTPDAARAEGLA
jgi:hypothetical protein